MLVEAGGCLGGAASQALVFPFMPYSTPMSDDPANPEKLILSRGFLTELVLDMDRTGAIVKGTRFNTEEL
ncbi:MAG: hypothetical protein J5794_05870, partial [Lachnospiraceae bacterium]|nr:hypothetical protein [Lachnospiraceae bacterium]